MELEQEPDLQCTLLAASACSYWIGQPGGVSACPQYEAAVFIEDPVVFQEGIDDINACLVSNTQYGVVLAFRGTLHFDIHDIQSLIDWMNDLDAEPVAVAGLPGKVHSGFHKTVESLWGDFLPEVKKRVDEGRKLYITGHSKGAPAAVIAGALLGAQAGIKANSLFLLAPPRPGDKEFVAGLPDLTGPIVCYEYHDDMVPHLPPTDLLIEFLAALPKIGHFFEGMTTWDYVSAGVLNFINWDDELQGETMELELERFEHMAKLIIHGDFKTIADDHALLGGYCSFICSAEICGAKS